jgi:hypothetical protein
MPRIRTLKPESLTDEKLATMDPVDRFVFWALILLADDAGRLVDNVKLIDGQVFSLTDHSCSASLDALAVNGRIIRYCSSSGQRLIQIANWAKHQKVDHPAKYVLPGPPSEGPADTLATSSRDSRAPTDDLRPVPTTSTSDPRERETVVARAPHGANGSSPSSSAEGVAPGSTAAPPGADRDPADLVVQAANRGMNANARIEHFNPIPAGQGKSVQQVRDWEAAGIPTDLMLRVVFQRASEYEPDSTHRQILNLRYFDAAVREAQQRAELAVVPGTEAERVAQGRYSETPGGGRRTQPRTKKADTEVVPLRDIGLMRELRDRHLGKRPATTSRETP